MTILIELERAVSAILSVLCLPAPGTNLHRTDSCRIQRLIGENHPCVLMKSYTEYWATVPQSLHLNQMC